MTRGRMWATKVHLCFDISAIEYLKRSTVVLIKKGCVPTPFFV